MICNVYNKRRNGTKGLYVNFVDSRTRQIDSQIFQNRYAHTVQRDQKCNEGIIVLLYISKGSVSRRDLLIASFGTASLRIQVFVAN